MEFQLPVIPDSQALSLGLQIEQASTLEKSNCLD